MAVASTGPVTTIRPVQSAVSWFSRRFLRPAADDMNGIEPLAGQLFQLLEGQAILERQAFQGNAHDLTLGLWHSLAALATELAEFFRHVAGVQKFRHVRVDHRQERLRLGCQAGDLVVGQAPLALAFLHQPQAHDVFGKPPGAKDPALVGEIVGQGLWGQVWLPDFRAHDRPGAGAEPGKIIVFSWHSNHRRAGIVAGWGDHRR